MPEAIIDATQSASGYLVSPLSDNISETDEGYLVIVGCPIARTGFQDYAVKDLPQEAAEALGVDISNPSATISLYRPASEVFAPEFLASLNGKPITDNHPENFVNADNFKQYALGHIQNPRKGTEQLEDGEWPLIADLVISGEPLIGKVRARTQRDVSLGYDYGIRREGKKIIQCDLLGNHAAIVPKGRAGDFVSIQDAAPELSAVVGTLTIKNGIVLADKVLETSTAAPPEPAAALPPEPSAGHAAQTNNAVKPIKEKHKVKNPLLHLFGLGLKAKAQEENTDPEELAQAALDMSKYQASRARAADSEDPDEGELAEEAAKDKKKSKDRKKGKDDLGDPEDKDVEPPAVDAGRKQLHDALDKVMDKKKGGKDADIEGLKGLLDQYLSEEEAEPEHAMEDGPADMSELEQIVGEETDAEEAPGEAVVESGEEELEPVADEEEEEVAEDGEACPTCGAMDGHAKDSRAKDRARAADGAVVTLKLLRPFVARSKDNALRATFNAALSTATRGSKPSTSSYSSFAKTASARSAAPARARAADANDSDTGIAKLQAAYDSALKGGK